MEKILDIVEVISYEKGLETSVVTELIKECMIKIAQEELSEDANFSVVIDEKERTLKLFQTLSICADGENHSANQISLTEAKALNAEASLGDELRDVHSG